MKCGWLRRFCGLLALCLALAMPAAMMEETLPAAEVPEAPVDEVVLELGEVADAAAEDEASLEAEDAAAVKGLRIDADAFPDEHFRQYVAVHFDLDGSGALTSDEIAEAKYINISRMDTPQYTDLSSLKGIERFTALESLTLLGTGNVASLDLTKNKKLVNLKVIATALKKLNVKKNTALRQLLVADNPKLTALDVSSNTQLTTLCCVASGVKSLDVSKNKALTLLECHSLGLKKLDVTHNPNLESLLCWNNALTSLDLRKNTKLGSLECDGNKLKTLNLSKNPGLYHLKCDHNALKKLDISACGALLSIYDNAKPQFVDGAVEYVEGYGELIFDEGTPLLGEAVPTFKLTKNAKHTVFINERIQLDLGGKTLSAITSSKPKVATAGQDGLIVPKKAGATTVTATLTTGKKLTLKLTVADPLAPTGITLNHFGTLTTLSAKDNLPVYLDESLGLGYAIAPLRATCDVRWTSSKPSVAAVENGTVIPKKVGTTTITATSVKGKLSAKVKVTVVDPAAPRSVGFPQGAKKTLKVGDTLELHPVVYAAPGYEVDDALIWKSGKPSVAKVDKKGKVTAVKAGTAKITATAKNGKSATFTVTVK